MHVVVMGVSGSGKSTVAAGVAEELGWTFAEADEFHPPANIAKMTSGVPLDDADREPWLRDLAAWMAGHAADGRDTVITCSALKRSYRDLLRADVDALAGEHRVVFAHVHAPVEVIAERMSGRSGHFMPQSLLQSQVETLEPLAADEDGLDLDARRAPEEIVAEVLTRL